MERPSRPNLFRLREVELSETATHTLQSRLELVASLYFDGRPPIALEEVEINIPNTIRRGSLDIAQDWLDEAHRNRYLRGLILQDADEEAWPEYQEGLTRWYQKGLLELDLLNAQDLRDFEEMYTRDSTIRYGRAPTINMFGALPDIPEDFHLRAHP